MGGKSWRIGEKGELEYMRIDLLSSGLYLLVKFRHASCYMSSFSSTISILTVVQNVHVTTRPPVRLPHS